VIGIFAYVNLSNQRRYLTHETIVGAQQLSGTLQKSLRFNMLHNYRDAIHNSIETVGTQQGIEKVRIFNKIGTIMYSSDRNEVGRMVDKEAAACYACHAVDEPLERLDTPKRSRIYQAGEFRVLGMINPIYNEPDCYLAECHVHPPDRKILGVLDLSLSLAQTDARIRENEEGIILFAIATIISVSAIITLILRKAVYRPVRELAEGTGKVARGEFGHAIPTHHRDEMGQLAQSFNQMTQKLKETDEELKDLIKNLEQRVEERTAKLKEAHYQLVQSEKLASIGKLAATIAHEINNPLSGILTYTKLIDRKLAKGLGAGGDTEKIQSYLGIMERETERCSSIVKNLLDFARRREPSFKADVDVNAVLDEALSLLSNQIALQEITLDKRYSEVPPMVGDPMQLRQVFVNLIVNACEAVQDNGIVTVTTSYLKSDQIIQIQVSDNGVGIAEEDMPKIRDPFFTSKEKGTGLGLAVVYGIVNSHQGSVDVTSTLGEGTTFTVNLPLEIKLEESESVDEDSNA
jgi:two-component system NtrC family sensor kinase